MTQAIGNAYMTRGIAETGEALAELAAGAFGIDVATPAAHLVAIETLRRSFTQLDAEVEALNRQARRELGLHVIHYSLSVLTPRFYTRKVSNAISDSQSLEHIAPERTRPLSVSGRFLGFGIVDTHNLYTPMHHQINPAAPKPAERLKPCYHLQLRDRVLGDRGFALVPIAGATVVELSRTPAIMENMDSGYYASEEAARICRKEPKGSVSVSVIPQAAE